MVGGQPRFGGGRRRLSPVRRHAPLGARPLVSRQVSSRWWYSRHPCELPGQNALSKVPSSGAHLPKGPMTPSSSRRASGARSWSTTVWGSARPCSSKETALTGSRGWRTTSLGRPESGPRSVGSGPSLGPLAVRCTRPRASRGCQCMARVRRCARHLSA